MRSNREPTADDLRRLHLGTAGWSYKDWVGPFYPPGTAQADMLRCYADRFAAVEIDSTFYGIPSERAVDSWRKKVPVGFTFSPKFPKTISHDKFLLDVEEESRVFLGRMERLGPFLGPLLLQFPYFNKKSEVTPSFFCDRLCAFLELFNELADPDMRLVVEVRNKKFLEKGLLDLLSQHGAALAIIDHPWMPAPDELLGRDDLVTAPFSYLRFLGDRMSIERITKTWDKEVLDLDWRLELWVQWIKKSLPATEIFVFANNHFTGFAPATMQGMRDKLGI